MIRSAAPAITVALLLSCRYGAAAPDADITLRQIDPDYLRIAEDDAIYNPLELPHPVLMMDRAAQGSRRELPRLTATFPTLCGEKLWRVCWLDEVALMSVLRAMGPETRRNLMSWNAPATVSGACSELYIDGPHRQFIDDAEFSSISSLR